MEKVRLPDVVRSTLAGARRELEDDADADIGFYRP